MRKDPPPRGGGGGSGQALPGVIAMAIVIALVAALAFVPVGRAVSGCVGKLNAILPEPPLAGR